MRAILGQRYVDSVTKVSGVATARTEYWDGTAKVRLERVERDGKPGEHWFSEDRLILGEDDNVGGMEVGNGRYA